MDNFNSQGQDPNYQNQGYQNFGNQNSDYQSHVNMQQTPPPDNHLITAIIVTVLCSPLGIPAIVNAAKVDRLWYSGARMEALETANRAQQWITASILISAVVVIAFIAIYITIFTFVVLL